MKLTKKLSRIAATVLALALLVCTAAVPAMAAGVESGTPVSTIDFTVSITTDGKSYEPDTDLTFSVTNGDAGTVQMPNVSGPATEVTVLEGIGGVSIAAIDTDPAATLAETYVNNGQIAIAADTFKSAAPGIYHYVVSQTTGNVEGMVYDTSVYDLYLYVQNGATGVNDHYVAYVVAVERGSDGSAGTQKTDISFVNKYGTKEPGPDPDPENKLHDVTIKKIVDGDMGDKVNDTFSFTVLLTGAADEKFYIEYTNKDGAQNVTATAGTPVELIGIQHDDVITIYGLSENDTFTVTEAQTTKGYTVYVDKAYTADHTYQTDGNTKTDTTGAITMGQNDHNIGFFNVLSATTPTGVIMDVAPYALMVVVAVVAGVVFLGKRRED